MKRTVSAVIALTALLGAGAVHAQATGQPPPGAQQPPAAVGEIKGTVTDGEAKTPVSRASVTVRNKTGTAIVAGALASADGTFRIQGLRPGTYNLRVTYLGYGPKLQEFTITPAAPQVNVGSVELARVAVALQSVEVNSARPTISIEPDRNTYRAKDVAPAAANAADVLDATPSVQVDGDGKISLRGNENVAVQMNGRPSPITGPQLAAYLKQIPASLVDRIEVVPNPSAKYDPEGMAGIINIVLKQNTDLGLSGGATAGGAASDRYNGGANLGYQSGPLTLFNSIGLNADNRNVGGINNQERFAALGIPSSFTNQNVDGVTTNSGQNFNSNIDYKLNARDVFSNALVVSHRTNGDDSQSGYQELNGGGTLLSRYDRFKNTTGSGLLFDEDLSLKRTFEPRKHELSGEMRFNRSHDDENSALWRQPLGTVAANVIEGERDTTSSVTYQLVAQTDYMHQLKPTTKLEAGYKGNARWLDRDYLVMKDALGTGAWIRSNLSNSFSFDETVNAVYGLLTQNVGKVSLQGGLRGEYATRNFSLANPNTSYPHNYGSLFPSAIVNYQYDDATQMKVSYSRRIRRPGTQELNPFPAFFDVQNVFIGNPKLSPEYTDAFELGLSKNGQLGTIQLSPFYRRTTNVIRVNINTADVIDGRTVTSISFQNLATSNSWGTDLNGSLRLGKMFNGFASFNVFKQVTDGGSLSALSSNAVSWSSRVSGTLNVDPTLTVNANYFYRAPLNIERGRFYAIQSAQLSMRKKIMGDQAAVSLRVADPFNTLKFKVNVGDDNVRQITTRTFDQRAVYLTFQYNYGKVPKVRQPTQQPQDQPAGGFAPPP